MSLYMWNPIDEELLRKLEQNKNGRKVLPLINAFRKLSNDDPYLYCPFEEYPVAMMRSFLKFLVEHWGFDKQEAFNFYKNHLAFASPRLNIEEAIAFYGEENFDNMLKEILKLADPYLEK